MPVPARSPPLNRLARTHKICRHPHHLMRPTPHPRITRFDGIGQRQSRRKKQPPCNVAQINLPQCDEQHNRSQAPNPDSRAAHPLQNAQINHWWCLYLRQFAHLLKHLLGHPLGNRRCPVQRHSAHNQILKLGMMCIDKQRDLLSRHHRPLRNVQPLITRTKNQNEKCYHRHNHRHAIGKSHHSAQPNQQPQKYGTKYQPTLQTSPPLKLRSHFADRVFQFKR